MGRGLNSPAWRRAWLAGRVTALLAVAAAGVLAIVHFSSWDAALGPSTHDPYAAPARQPSTSTIHRSRPAPIPERSPPGTTGVYPANPPRQSVAPSAFPPAPSSRTPRPDPARAPRATPPASPSPGSSTGRGAHPPFQTLPPSAALPTGPQCAQWVLATPLAEDKNANRNYNQVTGQRVGPRFFPAADSPLASGLLAARINGDFTGTTQEILRWAACKWGISQDIVFAQAAVESWWNQDTLGGWGTRPRACPAGHGLGADGRPAECPRKYGILQDRFRPEKAAWPGIENSTAMNADAAYAIWRSCYDGYESWLNSEPSGQRYRAGDEWGCVGRWFTGHWHTPRAQRYIARVGAYLSERIWAQPFFRQTS